MVEMGLVARPWIRAENNVRLHRPNELGNLSCQRGHTLQRAVRLAEEMKLLRAERSSGGNRLLTAQIGKRLRIHRFGRLAEVPVRHCEIMYLAAARGERGHRAAHADLVVVRMRLNAQRTPGCQNFGGLKKCGYVHTIPSFLRRTAGFKFISDSCQLIGSQLIESKRQHGEHKADRRNGKYDKGKTVSFGSMLSLYPMSVMETPKIPFEIVALSFVRKVFMENTTPSPRKPSLYSA